MGVRPRYVYGSLARISDLMNKPFDVEPLERDEWCTGDYVVGRYLGSKSEVHEVEVTSGRLRKLREGDLVVGSLGTRASTKENVGDWHLIKEDNFMHDICGSGMFGLETSFSEHYHPSPPFVYLGHVVRTGEKVCMGDFVPDEVVPTGPPQCPTIVLVGTSMSAGKTETARVIVQLLKEMGFSHVLYSKLTGGGYYQDIMSVADYADDVKDFVDAGLPSTNMPPKEYDMALPILFGVLSATEPDCHVVELGASPCEPYNGDIALRELGVPDFVVLCASDAYAVVGFHHMISKFTCIQADVVCGIAANTSAGRDFVERVSGIPALSLATDESVGKLQLMLQDRLFSKHSYC